MKITNKQGIPEPIYRALQQDWYGGEGEERFASATELLLPPRIFALRKKHEAEIVRDAADMLHTLRGSAMHKVLEKAGDENCIIEKRLKATVCGEVISGGVDLYDKVKHRISDFKDTSVWTYIYGSRLEEWTRQVNIYAYLYELHRFPVDELSVILMFRDWSASKKEYDRKYPPQCVELPLQRMETHQIKDFMERKVKSFKEALKLKDDALPCCTREERWKKPDKFAVMKKGRKSAVRVFDDEEKANDLLNDSSADHYIEVRVGASGRCCPQYCDVCKWCDYYKNIKK